MKSKLILGILLIAVIGLQAQNKKREIEYYKIIVYHFTSDSQQLVLDTYLKDAYLPALHKAGIKNIGVFKPVTNDTVSDKRIYVFISSSTLERLLSLNQIAGKYAEATDGWKNYIDAAYTQPSFIRMETILLQAFRLAPKMNLPGLTTGKKDHIYELRSYESATEKLNENKVTMFNEGGEITLFKRLNFNAVFYSNVISGSHMPNLMYMTSFDSMAERDAHWKTFGSDPEWKKLSALPEYQHNVSHIDITLMRATDYSDF
jgi:hypothetical protein